MYATGYRTGIELGHALGRIRAGDRPWVLDSRYANDPGVVFAQALSVARTNGEIEALPHWDSELAAELSPSSLLFTALDRAQSHVARQQLPLAALCTIATDELHVLLVTREPFARSGPLLGRVLIQFALVEGRIATAPLEIESCGHPLEPFTDGLRDGLEEMTLETLARPRRPDLRALGASAGQLVAEVLGSAIDGKRIPDEGYAIWREPGDPHLRLSVRDHEHFRRGWYHRQPPLNGVTLECTRRLDGLFLHVPGGWCDPHHVSISVSLDTKLTRTTVRTTDWRIDSGGDVTALAVDQFVGGVREGFAAHPRSGELLVGFGTLVR